MRGVSVLGLSEVSVKVICLGQKFPVDQKLAIVVHNCDAANIDFFTALLCSLKVRGDIDGVSTERLALILMCLLDHRLASVVTGRLVPRIDAKVRSACAGRTVLEQFFDVGQVVVALSRELVTGIVLQVAGVELSKHPTVAAAAHREQDS